MDPRIVPTVGHMKINEKLFNKIIKGVDDERALAKLTDKNSTLLFNAGHVTVTRFYLAGFMGIEDKWTRGRDFLNGLPKGDPDTYPKLSEIGEQFDLISVKLHKKIEEAAPEYLDGKGIMEIPYPEQNLLNNISFMAMHESYHIGQMGMLYKFLTNSGVF